MNLKHLAKACMLCLLIANLTACVNNQSKQLPTSQKKVINPWTWQYKHGMSGFVHANEITNPNRILFTAGQVSVNEEGNLLYPGDMANQTNLIISNLEAILEQADFEFSDIVRLTYYTTDVNTFKDAAVQKVLIDRLKNAGCEPATSLIGVKELFHPDCVIEIEATVAK